MQSYNQTDLRWKILSIKKLLELENEHVMSCSEKITNLRMPYSSTGDLPKKVVLLIKGEYASSDLWVALKVVFLAHSLKAVG